MIDKIYFHKYLWEALGEYGEDERNKFVNAYFGYAYYGTIPTWHTPYEKAQWRTMQEQLDQNINNYLEHKRKLSEAGKKGGAPKGNRNAAKTEKAMQDTQVIIPFDFFKKNWNDMCQAHPSNTMKPLGTKAPTSVDIPSDAQDRINELCAFVVNYIRQQGANNIAQCAKLKVPENFDAENEAHIKKLAKNIIACTISKLPSLKIQPQVTTFGSFQWFVKPENFVKVLNGEIQ